MFANIAWNESVGVGHARDSYRSAWEVIEADNPECGTSSSQPMWGPYSTDLSSTGRSTFPTICGEFFWVGIPNGSIRVEWSPPVAPGVDSQWEMPLYALIRTGEREQAISFLRETRRMSRTDAVKQVMKVASDLGLG
jgi:hypothetical protein